MNDDVTDLSADSTDNALKVIKWNSVNSVFEQALRPAHSGSKVEKRHS